MKNENRIIKNNTHIHHMRVTDFTTRRMHKTYDATIPINTLNLKANVHFSQNDYSSRP